MFSIVRDPAAGGCCAAILPPIPKTENEANAKINCREVFPITMPTRTSDCESASLQNCSKSYLHPQSKERDSIGHLRNSSRLFAKYQRDLNHISASQKVFGACKLHR
jgi:hypothetical protein